MGGEPHRMVGLAVFGYVLLHMLSYAGFDMDWDAADIAKDIAKRPFILVGFTAFVLLSLLAATSFNRAVKWLGAVRWQALHKSVYAIAFLAILHFFWMRAGKQNFAEVAVYASIIGALLGWRVWHKLSERKARSACLSADSEALATQHVGQRVAGADDAGCGAIDQHFAGFGAGVVVAGHGHAVRTG
jgi:methionine sulfoxide reductase heme-binding subunit